MDHKDAHISDEDLILSADGELSRQRAAEIQTHLNSCWTCRGRSKEIEEAITSFVRAYHDDLDSEIPSPRGPRALLKARLSQLAAEQQPKISERFDLFGLIPRRVAYLLGIFVLALAALMLWPSSQPSLAWSPNPQLTPGVTLPVTESDICGRPDATRTRAVLESVGKKVFEQYGIRNPQPRHYELDYLIDPDLGGADDTRNLWPQPYSALWSANVKDALEDHLRQLVCANKITLAQAQRDISMDWISAYKLYFHTDRPFPIHQAFRKDQPWE